MGGHAGGWANGRASESVSESVIKSVSEWASEQVNGPMGCSARVSEVKKCVDDQVCHQVAALY